MSELLSMALDSKDRHTRAARVIFCDLAMPAQKNAPRVNLSVEIYPLLGRGRRVTRAASGRPA